MAHHDQVKINKAVAWTLALLAALPTGCSRPPAVSPPPIRPTSSVPPGCDPGSARVQWSGIAHEPVLEHAALFTAEATGEGTVVLDAPVTAAVTGVTAPDTWLRLLATDLESEIGVGVRTTRPSSSYGMGFGSWGEVDPDIAESVSYMGVRRVSAAFTVECTPTVGGILTAWTETKAGGLMCGDLTPSPDPYEQAARRYCPRTPPAPSS